MLSLTGSTVPLPLYGKASDIWGRKPVLFISIGFFELGSALCGASTNMPMLIASRVVQGIGGGGIMGLVNIILTDVTSLRYSQDSIEVDTKGPREMECWDRCHLGCGRCLWSSSWWGDCHRDNMEMVFSHQPPRRCNLHGHHFHLPPPRLPATVILGQSAES